MATETERVFRFINNWNEKPLEPAQYTAGNTTYTLQSGFIGVYSNGSESLPLGLLEVTYTHHDKPHLKRRLLEMRLKLDKKGNPVGLGDDKFNFWHRTTDDHTTYRIEYKVSSKNPACAQIGTIHKYSPEVGIDQDMTDIDQGLAEMTLDSQKTGLAIPKAVDWKVTSNIYCTLLSEKVFSQNGAIQDPAAIATEIAKNPLREAV